MISFFGLNQHIAIDLGTCTTKVYVRGKGLVVDEPTVAAIRKDTGAVYAVGEAARKMAGKTPPGLEVIFPMSGGVISDFDLIEKLLQYYVRISFGHMRFFKPVIIVSVPCVMTEVEARAVVEAAGLAGARKVYLLREPIAVALASGADISKPEGLMVIDIGGGTTDYAVISLSGLSMMQSIRVAGNKFNEDIAKYVHHKFGLTIGTQTAENAKHFLACLDPAAPKKTMGVKGRDYISRLPRSVPVTSDMIAGAIADSVDAIAENAKNVLERTPPELVADVLSHGIILSGGGSLIGGLDVYLSKYLKTPVIRAEEPQYAVIKGQAKAMEKLDSMTEGIQGLRENRLQK